MTEQVQEWKKLNERDDLANFTDYSEERFYIRIDELGEDEYLVGPLDEEQVDHILADHNRLAAPPEAAP